MIGYSGIFVWISGLKGDKVFFCLFLGWVGSFIKKLMFIVFFVLFSLVVFSLVVYLNYRGSFEKY